eukprot:GILJ01002817.1.p1 GENE.GILJ01002817.1~~GILJ01002817.1.p1  ORF type:complete len:441 (+),score=54.61 GILJ01002817.1:101-1423(+)
MGCANSRPDAVNSPEADSELRVTPDPQNRSAKNIIPISPSTQQSSSRPASFRRTAAKYEDQGSESPVKLPAPGPSMHRRRLSVNPLFSPNAAENGSPAHKNQSATVAPASLPGYALHRRSMSIAGKNAMITQRAFDPKPIHLKLDEEESERHSVPSYIGFVCQKGYKPDAPNQDTFFIFEDLDQNFALYAVFDGHGPYGHDVSDFVKTYLPSMLMNHPLFNTDPMTALKVTFETCNQNLISGRHDFDAAYSGATGTVILHRENQLFMAHVGDSRAIMGVQDAGQYIPIELTPDHKCDLPEERARILAGGGDVKMIEGDIQLRVYLKNQMIPGLAMTRAFGDTVAASVGVIATPEVSTYNIDPAKDKFIILASDGIWEFLSNEQVIAMAAPYLTSGDVAGAQHAVERLWSESKDLWLDEEGVVDDITCLLILLDNPAAVVN